MNVICAFSSDRKELYKADIYRALALPAGHIVHFRYENKYVADKLFKNIGNLKNEKAVIFYTNGNRCKADKITHTSIRWVTISHAEISSETGVFHAYLKLGNFCDIKLDKSLINKLPDKFFSEYPYTESNEKIRWENRVSEVKKYFTDTTFFYLKGVHRQTIFHRDKELPLIYQNNNKFCHYNLVHGKRYVLKISVGNPLECKSKIKITDSSGEITINCVNPIETSVPFDDYDIPTYVKTLQIPKQTSLITFRPTNGGTDNLGEYATNIELNLIMDIKRPFYFGLLSTALLLAFLLAKSVSSTIEWPPSWEICCSIILTFLATGTMFYLFNKK